MDALQYSKRIRRWRLASCLALCLSVAALWIVFDSLFAPFGTKSESVEIPDYRGQVLDSIEFADWMEVETEYRYDTEHAAGTVLSQTPLGGSYRKLSAQSPTCRLSLVVSLGEETATVPNLIGLDAREAEIRLRELGFSVKLAGASSTYPDGTVCAILPQEGSVLPIGSAVVLTVSKGAQPVTVTVPELRGLNRSDALVQLWLAQLAVGDVVEELSDAPEGTVIRQSHQSGTLVTAGTKITLYISREIEE